jgi:DNA-binding transcriptional MerR regulator
MDRTASQDIWLSAAECASRTGLTIRALRLYEQHGLIRPRRTGNNWRLYGRPDLERLSEIVTLKSFGLPISRIAELLAGRETDVESILGLQHASLLKVREGADRGLALIQALQAKMEANGPPSVNDLVQIAKEITMTQMTAESVAWKRYEQSRPRTENRLDKIELDDYVGFYEMSDHTVIEIRNADHGLAAKVTGQPEIDIYPECRDRFFYKAVIAQLSFDRNALGEVTSLVLHQDGFERPGRRISAAEAELREKWLRARIREKKPFPGSAEMIRKLIAEAISGKVDWSSKSDEFRLSTEAWVPGMKAWLSGLGEVRGHEFAGVNSSGWDAYHVTFDKAVLEWNFFIDKEGRLSGEWIRDLPQSP